MDIATSFNNDGHPDVDAVAALESTIDPVLLSTKRVVFVGGLPAASTIPMIRAAMIPFGSIQSIDMVRVYIKFEI
jgi:hypothetical protein